jgi:hypothetical protein
VIRLRSRPPEAMLIAGLRQRLVWSRVTGTRTAIPSASVAVEESTAAARSGRMFLPDFISARSGSSAPGSPHPTADLWLKPSSHLGCWLRLFNACDKGRSGGLAQPKERLTLALAERTSPRDVPARPFRTPWIRAARLFASQPSISPPYPPARAKRGEAVRGASSTYRFEQ